MKTLRSRLLPLLMFPLLLAGCTNSNDDDDPTPTGPKEYQVEYRVTAVNYSQADIIYRDVTETILTEKAVSVPKSYTFKRTLKAGDFLSVGAFATGGDSKGSVKCAILLDGKEVENESDTGPDPEAVASYVMP